jgi:MFS family permease
MVLVAGSAILALATISDAFIYLLLQRRTGFNPGFLPLLYVATATSYLVLAIPLGRLADRVGRGRIVVAGYLLLALAYVALLTSAGGAGLFVACLLVLGAYYAATDGVMAALTSAATPVENRTTGLALHGTAVGLAQLGGSVFFGLLWTVAGADFAITVFLALLLVGIAGLSAGLARTASR